MNKVLVIVDDGCIYFSKYNREIKPENLNNTNVINAKKLKFTEEYIQENLDLISTFFNLIVLKFKVESVVIKDLDIAETAILLVNTLNPIKYLCLSEDNCLNYTISSLLLQNNNLIKIECYNMPEMMFYRFNEDIIKTRCSVTSTSEFFKYNNIKTNSDIYNKKSILISKLFTSEDIEDIKYFFETNKNLKKVEFKPYNKINFEAILKLLKKNYFKKINIIIHEDEKTTEEILKDIPLFNKLNKIFNVDIRIKYSKQYKEKNKIKELNIVLFRYILVVCIVISFFLFLGYKYSEKKNTDNIENDLKEINEVIKEVENQDIKQENNVTNVEQNENQYISSYYKNYSKIYDELLNINSDTVGWLTVSNTKINYPVVQTRDNEYYLDRAFDKSINNFGWIFVDYRNNMDNLSKNTIVYGHSASNSDLMFSTLKNTLDEKWYKDSNNLIIKFNIKNNDYSWQVFSIYSIEETTDYLYSDFQNDESFMNFINKIKLRSINDFNIEINSSDKILTLSTCYKNGTHRIVLHAKLIEN